MKATHNDIRDIADTAGISTTTMLYILDELREIANAD